MLQLSALKPHCRLAPFLDYRLTLCIPLQLNLAILATTKTTTFQVENTTDTRKHKSFPTRSNTSSINFCGIWGSAVVPSTTACKWALEALHSHKHTVTFFYEIPLLAPLFTQEKICFYRLVVPRGCIKVEGSAYTTLSPKMQLTDPCHSELFRGTIVCHGIVVYQKSKHRIIILNNKFVLEWIQ